MTLRLLILFLIVQAILFEQTKLNGKFVNDAYNENNYLIFFLDSTFIKFYACNASRTNKVSNAIENINNLGFTEQNHSKKKAVLKEG